MKNFILFFAITTLFSIKVSAQETCKIGIYLPSHHNDEKPVLLYTEDTFNLDCEKTSYGRLKLPSEIVMDIRIQFFQHLKNQYSELLESFRNSGRGNMVTVLVLQPNESYEERVYKEVGVKTFGYTVHKIQGFNYNSTKYIDSSQVSNEAYNEYRTFFLKR